MPWHECHILKVYALACGGGGEVDKSMHHLYIALMTSVKQYTSTRFNSLTGFHFILCALVAMLSPTIPVFELNTKKMLSEAVCKFEPTIAEMVACGRRLQSNRGSTPWHKANFISRPRIRCGCLLGRCIDVVPKPFIDSTSTNIR